MKLFYLLKIDKFPGSRGGPACSIAACLLVFSVLLSGCHLFPLQEQEKQLFAMDTFMTMKASGKQANDALEEASQELLRLDELWSIANSNGEIGVLNQTGCGQVSEDTQALLDFSLEISAKTNGALDLTVLPLMELWGFTSQDYHVPSTEEIEKRLPFVGMQHIRAEESMGPDHYSLDEGTQIDLGSVAKGYASDRVRDIFLSHGITSGLINLGGNIYALGKRPDGADWTLGIENPRSEDLSLFGDQAYLGKLKLHDKAVVTSGDYHRFFIEGGKRYHHIMDPSTGAPAESDLISITVVTNSGTLADALSTALFVSGHEKAVEYWRNAAESFDLILADANGTLTITEGIEDSFFSEQEYTVVDK